MKYKYMWALESFWIDQWSYTELNLGTITKEFCEDLWDNFSQDFLADVNHLQNTAKIADILFNPIIEKEDTEYLVEMDEDSKAFFEQSSDSFQDTDTIEWVTENILYDFTPIVWVFFEGKLIFASKNYTQALDYNYLEELKSDVLSGKVLQKYTLESQILAKNAIERLRAGESYKNLILETIKGKKISWNSYWNRAWLEVRIWIDISNGAFLHSDSNIITPEFKGFEFNTVSLTNSIRTKAINILNVQQKKRLNIISELCSIVDKIWNDWPYIMNAFTTFAWETQILANSNYTKAILLPYNEIIRKQASNTLFSDHYDEETQLIIKDLFDQMRKDNYFIENFPMIDSQGNKKLFNWFRHILSGKSNFWPDSIGIGTKYKSNQDIMLLQNM